MASIRRCVEMFWNSWIRFLSSSIGRIELFKIVSTTVLLFHLTKLRKSYFLTESILLFDLAPAKSQRDGAQSKQRNVEKTVHLDWCGCFFGVFGCMLCDNNSNLVDPASSHTLVSKIKPCMCQYKRFYTVKLRTAHYISYSLFDTLSLLDNRSNSRANTCLQSQLTAGCIYQISINIFC